MPINERMLEVKIRSLQLAIAELESRLRAAKTSYQALASIQLGDNYPTDPGTGMPFTEERRQEICDCWMPKADKLLDIEKK